LLAALGLGLWLAALLLWRPVPVQDAPPPATNGGRGVVRRLSGLLLAAPGALVAAAFIALDQERAAPLSYLAPALLGVLAVWLLGLLARRLPQIFGSFSAF
jgi:hypothetical protein